MSANQNKTESKIPNRGELQQRLQVLVERDREALAVFAARCALRVLPLTAVKGAFNYWPSEKQQAYAHSVFAASVMGLAYKETAHFVAIATAASAAATDASVSSSPTYDDVAAASAAYATTAAYAAATTYASAATAAYNDATAAAAATYAAASSASSDLVLLEQGEVLSVKQSALWLGQRPSRSAEQVDAWSEAMRALKLSELAQFYGDLLRGERYSSDRLLGLIHDWYEQYGYQYTKKIEVKIKKPKAKTKDQSRAKAKIQVESDLLPKETASLPKETVRYEQTHANIYDGLAERDALGRQQLAEAMVAILSAKENHQHQTIGLLGDWGAGKSTFVNLLKQSIQEKSKIPFLFAEFNAWEYVHTGNIQAGMTREALKGLVSDLGWWQKLDLAWKFTWQEKPWYVYRLLLATAGLIIGTIVGSLQFDGWEQFFAWIGLGSVSALIIWKFICSLQALFNSPLVKEWKSVLNQADHDHYLGTIPVMKQQIRKLCKLRLGLGKDKPAAAQKRLLFVVDDLDRCNHIDVVKILEAVRLIMGVPQVTVIIAIDQRIALASLALHYKDLEESHVGRDPGTIARDYLGKVIQMPVQLHAADGNTVTSFINQVLLNDAEKPILKKTSGVPNRPNKNEHSTPSNPLDMELLGSGPDSLYPLGKGVSEKPSFKVPVIGKIEYQLSPKEKQVFKDRVKQFGFHNPRQIKRLYNSFNLLRHLNGSDQADDHMLVLFWLEYLNSSSENEAGSGKNKDLMTLNTERYQVIEKQVKPFVLPALDKSLSENVSSPSTRPMDTGFTDEI